MFNLIWLKKYNGATMPSGNPILYQASVKPAGYSYQQLYVQVTVKVQNAPGASIYNLVKTEKLEPAADGLFSFDISSLCSPYLEFFKPDANLDNAVDCVKQLRNFEVTVDLYEIANNNLKVASLTDTVRVFKGGVAMEYFLPVIGNRIYSNEEHYLFFSEPDEITGQLKETVFADDHFWLSVLLPSGNTSPYYFGFTLKYLDVDGTEKTKRKNLYQPQASGAETRIILFPGGYQQNSMHLQLPSGATAISYYFEIFYKDSEGNSIKRNLEPYPVFYIEQRNFYNTRKLVYRSSLGCLMPLTIRGQIDNEGAYESQTNSTRRLEWLTNGNVIAARQQSRAIEDYKFKGETGLVSKFQAERLRDFFMSDERYEYMEGRLVPITVNTKSVKYFSNLDSLYNIAIEWQYALRNVHWSMYDLPGQSCPAMLHFSWYHAYNNTLQVMYSLPPGYNFLRVNVLFPGEAPQYFFIEGNAGTTTVTFDRPESASGTTNIFVNANVMCGRYNKVPSYGPLFVTDAGELDPKAPLLAAPDTFLLPAGITSPTAMSGSVLGNDSDPNGGAISVVPVTSVATDEGGVISIDADGNVTYTPPSEAYTGIDGYDYTLTNGTETATGHITFNVGVAIRTWAGVFHDEYTPSGFAGYYNKRYIALWDAPNALMPVTGSLTVNYRVTVKTYAYDASTPGLWVLTSTVNNDYTAVFTNESKKLIRTGNLEFVIQYPVVGLVSKLVTSFTVLPGTGYSVI